jgi:hypothetical protein
MKAEPPAPVKLTDGERTILRRINFDDPTPDACRASRELMESLAARNAIPEIRRQWFVDPAHAFSHGKSRLDNFSRPGRPIEEVFELPNFLKILKYFIQGPQLSAQVAKDFCDAIVGPGTSGEQLTRLREFVRREIRNSGCHKNEAAEEFYKLALECDLDSSVAKSIRDAAKSTK